MTNEDIYKVWSAESSPWGKWVKPVIFPFLIPEDQGSGECSVQDWKVLLHPDSAIIADLPGSEGVSAGIAMARAGYRPVLLYNALPDSWEPARETQELVAIDMCGILVAVRAVTKELASLKLPPQAPPAFLLDANRHGWGTAPDPGWLDNRSFVTPSDFPDASYFRRLGISKVILIRPNADGTFSVHRMFTGYRTGNIGSDLLGVLLRLQRAGMTIAAQAPWEPWAPRPLIVEPPMFILSSREWLRQRFSYCRNLDGSFGREVTHGAG